MKCPSCSYLRRISDEGDRTICPQCGIQYKKFIRGQAKKIAREREVQERKKGRVRKFSLPMLLKIIGVVIVALIGYDYLLKDSSISWRVLYRDLVDSAAANVEASWVRHPPLKVSGKSCGERQTLLNVDATGVMAMVVTNTSDRYIQARVRGEFEDGRYFFNNPKKIHSGKMGFISFPPNEKIPILIMLVDSKVSHFCDFYFESESETRIPFVE